MWSTSASRQEDAIGADLAAILDRLTALAEPGPEVGADVEAGPAASAGAAEGLRAESAVHIDRIALLERLRAVVAAAQHAEIVAFARAQVEFQIATGALDPAAVGRGVADQVALACRISPYAGSRRLTTARALHCDLPGTRALLRGAAVSEDTAERVVSETRHLDPQRRREVDTRIVAAGIEDLGAREAAATAKRLAYQADPAGYTARGRTARADRRVTLRPAPDTMAVLSALLPVEQAVACLASLRKAADTATTGSTAPGGEPPGSGSAGRAGPARNRCQVMADTLVERLTGQATAADVNVEVGIVLPVDALVDPDGPTVAEIVGHGPVPARIARDILGATGGKSWWRRLFTRPAGGPLIGADPRRRCFDGVLAALVRIRDGDRCRDPYCDAPARHIDHIVPARAGGPTSLTNGRTVCVRGNQVREVPGWRVETVHDGLGQEPHTVRTTTPTGHAYTSRAGP